MTLYDHIQQLRAELAVSFDAEERRQIQAELKAAEAEQARRDAALDAWLAQLE